MGRSPGALDLALRLVQVNSFRLVLDRYLGTDLGLLPDRNYVYPHNEDLYPEVTPAGQPPQIAKQDKGSILAQALLTTSSGGG